METVSLAAKSRSTLGSRPARRSRRAGVVPATVYGHGMKALSIEVGEKDLFRALHTKAGSNVVIGLQVEGVALKESTCLIKVIQRNPVTEAIDHVDFTVISMTEKIVVKVPLVVLNTVDAVGVKEGGNLDVIHHEIEVECLPTQIPGKIEVDVKMMKIGDALYAKDLPIPKEVTCTLDGDEVILALHPPAKEEVAATDEAATQPEVIEKGKKPEEGAEAEKAPAPAAGAGKAAPAKAAPAK